MAESFENSDNILRDWEKGEEKDKKCFVEALNREFSLLLFHFFRRFKRDSGVIFQTDHSSLLCKRC